MGPTKIFLAALVTILMLSIIKTFNIALPISVTTRVASGELSVVGEGKVDVVPNTATVSVGIVVSDVKTISEAQKGINETNNKIVEALKKLGIDEKDIKTSNYSINPNYNYSNGKNTITGYFGNATLSVKVRKPEILPKVITSATEAGANQIYDTQFIVESPEKYREEARNKAIANAKEQAQKLAKSLGITLGKVVNIVESSSDTGGGPVPLKLEVGGGGGSAPNLSGGTQTINSVVTLYFEKR